MVQILVACDEPLPRRSEITLYCAIGLRARPLPGAFGTGAEVP